MDGDPKSAGEVITSAPFEDDLGGIPQWVDEDDAPQGPTWEQILDQWPLIVADFHETYGVDLTLEFLASRSWAWLQARIVGLLTGPVTYLQVETKKATHLVRLPSTRLATALFPPQWPEPEG